ncbi:MAG: LamG-like jellyroll fold domain-containing protein [Planctomycetota bacterium]
MKTTRMLTILVLVLVVGLPAGIANADFTFGTRTNLGPTVNSSADDGLPSISADGLSLFFMSNRPDGYGERDIWVTTRATTDDPWGEPVNLGSQVNRSSGEWGASISSDGLLLYFCSWRSGGYGRSDVYVTTRETKDDPWGTPMNLGPTVNSSANDECPSISADELLLFFHSDRPGNVGEHDIWVTTRATKDDDWATPVNLGPPINTSAVEWCSNISADGRTLFFVSGRYGGYGRTDIWVTRRVTTDDDWGEPVNLGSNVNTSTFNYGVTVSADGSTLFFRTGPFDSGDIWQAPIIPIVDLNGDEIVDSVDMCIMVDHWGTSEPLCDIGPMPWGDGIVDVQDLIVLSEHLFEEILPLELVAYWKLDETEGDIAADSARENDAVVFGDAIWQPDGGQVSGALQFDGIDDYVSTPFMLQTANAVFSVFAWVKGGMPSQVIFSQAGLSDWLGADTTNGSLMTELNFLFKPSLPLQSQTVITDGNWHRIGLVWDGSNRILYVDDVEVASDTYDKGYLFGDLQIGAGKNLEPGSFFSGLIDDVRIYDRAITP